MSGHRGILLLGIIMAVSLLAAAQPALGLTDKEIKSLEKAGLSEETVQALTALQMDENRRRPPALTVNEVLELRRDGFTDEVIRLFIGLDLLTGNRDSLPVTPRVARELKEDGADDQTIRVMLAAEIARASGGRPASTVSAGGSDQSGLVRQEVDRGDGKKTIIYGSPFGGDGARLGVREINLADGKKAIIYYSASDPEAGLKEAQRREEEFQRAMDILSALQINIDIGP